MDIKKQVIIFDRIGVYRDFIINLTHYIFTYYIDDGSFTKEDDDKFYDWCFNKVCDEFKEQGIDFTKNKNIKKYFKDYYYKNHFYASEDSKQTYEFYLDFWSKIFSEKTIENGKVVSSFIDIYRFFDETINERKHDKVKTCTI